MGMHLIKATGRPGRAWTFVGCHLVEQGLAPSFIPFGCRTEDLWFLALTFYRPYQMDGPFTCPKCAAPVVPCDVCGNPAMCGEARCRPCQPDG